jgi:hypothetical protein
MTSKKNIRFKNTSGWIYVVFCACDKMLFSAVFCFDRAVYKFDFKIFKNEMPKNGNQCIFNKKTTSFSNRDSCFWQFISVFLRASSWVWRDTAEVVEVNCILLRKEVDRSSAKSVLFHNLPNWLSSDNSLLYGVGYRQRRKIKIKPVRLTQNLKKEICRNCSSIS